MSYKIRDVKRKNQINKKTYVSKRFPSLLFLSSWIYRTHINCLASISLEPIICDAKTHKRVGLFHRLVFFFNFYKNKRIGRGQNRLSTSGFIFIKSFYCFWSIGHPWRASRHCGLQLSPLTSSHDLLVLLISSSVVLRHVLFGLPLLLYPLGFQCNAVFFT